MHFNSKTKGLVFTLKLYICPSCKGTRYVSLENTTCYRCNRPMLLSNMPYADFIELDLEERKQHIQNFLGQCDEIADSQKIPSQTTKQNSVKETDYASRIIPKSSRCTLPLYEQEPVSLKHCEEIILLSNLRQFHGAS